MSASQPIICHHADFAFGNNGGGASFKPASVSGPKALARREVIIHLRKRDLAYLLGQLKAEELADQPEVFQALLTLQRWLDGVIYPKER